MAGGLAALLDDIAALAKLAAASVDDVGAAAGRASAKAAGVVIDDTAVTPRYVQGFTAERELPVIKKIGLGSLRNKLLIIVPAALLLSQFLPWVLTPLLMLGGTYLCFEGAEKLYEHVTHRRASHGEKPPEQAPAGESTAGEPTAATVPTSALPAVIMGPDEEQKVINSAIRTDFILSAEIMVIALGEVADQPLLSRTVILVVVAFAITLLVYGVVALIVKMDDVGLSLAQRDSPAAQRTGRALVTAMPKVLAVLSIVGMVAMLWVGGHILLVGTDTLGWSLLYGAVHHLEQAVAAATGALGGILGWLTNTFFSALLGLLVGAIAVTVAHLIPRRHARSQTPAAT